MMNVVGSMPVPTPLYPGPWIATVKNATILLIVLASLCPAQQPVTLHTGAFASAGASGSNTMVRASNGTLYMARIESVSSTNPIMLYASTDNGGSWASVFSALSINTASSGLSGTDLTNNLNMVIDDADQLHFTFANLKYPSFFACWYRRLDLNTGTLSPLIDLKAAGGATISTSVRTSACAIAIGPNNEVYLAAPSGSSWKTQLLVSTQPYAFTDTFTNAGVISANGGSAQHVRLAVDSLGNVQCTYYENTGSGDYRHRTFDPITQTFGSPTDLGDLSAPNDNWGAITTDSLGNTHIVCVRNAGGVATSNHPDFVYYMRDSAGTFSAPLNISSATNAQFASNNKYVMALNADQASGDCYLLFRDFALGGSLELMKKGLSDTAFSQVTQVMPATTTQHAYYVPTIHGSLWPVGNRYDGSAMHMNWREGSSSPYAARYMRLLSGGQVSFLPTAQVSSGSAMSVFFDDPNHPNETYIPFISCAYGQTPVLNTGFFLPVAADSCFGAYFSDPTMLFIFILGQPGSYFGTLDGTGHATGVIAIPTWVSPSFSLPIIVGFVTADSNGVTSVSQAEPFLIN